jgi:hypothetical protein
MPDHKGEPMITRPRAVVLVVLVASIALIAGTTAQAGTKAKLRFGLSGAQVPEGGDPDGRGRAVLKLNPAEQTVCFEVKWSRLDGEVTAMHIHKAPRRQTGGHHIDLFNDEHFVGQRNQLQACVQVLGHDGHDASEAIEEVLEDPEGFYLNIHSTAHPAGAIRGQLG